DRCDALARDARNRSRARTRCDAIHMHRAGAAQPSATSEFCSGEFERIAQDPKQRRLRRGADFPFTAVDTECEVGHGAPIGYRNRYRNCATWYSSGSEKGKGTEYVPKLRFKDEGFKDEEFKNEGSLTVASSGSTAFFPAVRGISRGEHYGPDYIYF